MKYPQWKILHLAMTRGKKITGASAFRLCGTLNLWKRIQDIEDNLGIVVNREWKKVGNRRIREFSL